jgi:hypothetical protein
MFERDYVEAVPPRRAPLPVRVSRRSQLITALRQRVRPIVIEDQELACPFARLLRARELQVWAPGEVVADTMSYSIARCYGTDIEGQWHMGRYVLPGNVEKVILKPKQDVGQTAMMVPRAAARPRNVSGSTPLSHVKRLSTTERPSDAAGGLLVLCALVCGSVMFGFYMQTQQTHRLGLAAAYAATSAEMKTHKSLARAANRVSEIRAPANDDSREAGNEITSKATQIVKPVHVVSPARAAEVKRIRAVGADSHAPFAKGAYPGYAAQY